MSGETAYHFTTEKKSMVPHIPNNNSFILYLLNPRSGPAYDLQVLRKLMWANRIPQGLTLMCMDAQEVSMGNKLKSCCLFWYIMAA